MARPKKSETNTTSVVEEEKTTEVEKIETPVETETTEVVEESKPVEEKPEEKKPVNDNAKVVIKCAAYAGKSIVLPTRTIQLDEKGCCEVSGIEAKRLLSIPGYELSK